jgi:ABC-type branched-subunit amino acid transport system substrate-binding protein
MRTTASVAVLAVVAAMATACGSSSGGGGSSSSSDGKPITVGVVTSLSGDAASGYTETEAGVKAAFGIANADGGVHGHKLTFQMLDDQSSAAGAATAVKTGIEQDHDFALFAVSAFFFGGYKFATLAKEPVIGAGQDGGPEWVDIKDNPTTFDVLGGVNYTLAPTTWGKVMKILGVTKASGLAYTTVPSSAETAEGAVTSAKAAGIPTAPPIQVPYGTTNVEPQALAMKSQGVNGILVGTLPSTGFALFEGLQQQGVHLKAGILPTGYGGALLSDKAAVAAAQGDYFSTTEAPVEANTPATRKFVAALKTYAGATGDPAFAAYQGYLVASAFIYGLTHAGANPTQSSFVTALRHATWNSAGLEAPVNFAHTGDIGAGMGPGDCIYLPQLEGTKFVLNPKLNPVCGTIIKGVTNSP